MLEFSKIKALPRQVRGTKNKLDFLRVFFKLINHPNDTLLVFELQEQLLKNASLEQRLTVFEQLKKIPSIGQSVAERFLAPDYKVEELAEYAPGTLGYAYYRHMHDNGFAADFFPKVEIVDEMSYFELRMRQTHDLWHVLTGYGPSIPDEIGLQAFYAAQSPMPFNWMLISSGLLHSVLINRTLGDLIMNAIREGYTAGRAARGLHAGQWETMWERPLAEVRAEYGIEPVSNRYDFELTASAALVA